MTSFVISLIQRQYALGALKEMFYILCLKYIINPASNAKWDAS